MGEHKKLNLALQGGGAHGAYTWGVLDRLLEDEEIIIDSISGTSAGAMNAVVLADGYRRGGRLEAKQQLQKFWERVSQVGSFTNPTQPTEVERYAGGWNIDGSLSYQWFDMLTRMFSPYQLNPYNLNPLKTVLDEVVDWKNIHNGGAISLFLTATSVRTCRPRVFRCHEVTSDVVLASACIPFFFQSVEIDGEPYWDGGYMGNPSIWPLIYYTDVHDVLLVQINPILRHETPKTAHDIINRVNEITFNASLIAEMRAINFVSRLVKENQLDPEKYRDIRMHMIAAPEVALGLNASSKVNTDWRFLQYLHGLGRDAAGVWLAENKKNVGQSATIDINETFLTPRASARADKAAE